MGARRWKLEEETVKMDASAGRLLERIVKTGERGAEGRRLEEWMRRERESGGRRG